MKITIAPLLLGCVVLKAGSPAEGLDLRTRPRTMAEADVPRAASGSETLQRILIKFRVDTEARSAASSEASSERTHQRITAAAQDASTGLVRGLSHLRAASGGNHVYETDQALNRTQMQAVIASLARDPAVESVTVDERVYSHAFSPNDPDYTGGSLQWYLKAPSPDLGAANFANAWNRSTSAPVAVSGQGVTVAVLDTGYRAHADLAANILAGYDFVSADATNVFVTANDGSGRDNDALDPGDGNTDPSNCTTGSSSWHGTRVSGLIAAVTNNSAGMAGAAYGAKVVPARVLGVCGGYLSDVVDAIRWSAGITVSGLTNPNPAKVINLSLGSTGTCSAAYQSAINDVRTQKMPRW